MHCLNIHDSGPNGYHLSIPPLPNNKMSPKPWPHPVTSLLLQPRFLLASACSAIREILPSLPLQLPLLAVLGLFWVLPEGNWVFLFFCRVRKEDLRSPTLHPTSLLGFQSNSSCAQCISKSPSACTSLD